MTYCITYIMYILIGIYSRHGYSHSTGSTYFNDKLPYTLDPKL